MQKGTKVKYTGKIFTSWFENSIIVKQNKNGTFNIVTDVAELSNVPQEELKPLK